MTLVRNSVRYLRGITFVIPCRNLFAANNSSPEANLFAVANCYARFQEIFGELVRQILRSPRTQFAADSFAANGSLEVDVFLPANEFSGELFASSRRSTGELGRTRANSAELRRTFGVLRRTFGGVSVLANRWRIRAEFARVCSSSPEFARVRGERQFAGYTARDSMFI